MSEAKYPPWYAHLKEKHGAFVTALEQLGESIRQEGPISGKTAHLIQLAAAAAIRSQGSVHSHTRQALQNGASPEEIYHALIMLTSTIGFPTVSAALSWAYDVIEKEKK
jgi:4-carboxymuconolactone decarboxylase